MASGDALADPDAVALGVQIDGLQVDAAQLAVAAGLALEWVRPPESITTGRPPAISGKRIVFTGKMQRGSRQEMMRLAEGVGAVVQTAVSGNTDILVCGEKVGGKKMAKARRRGPVGQGKKL